MKKVLITGATGFVGNHVIEQILLKEDIEIIASSRSEDKARMFSWFDKVTYVPWLIGTSDNETVYETFGSPDLCIHLAWDGLNDFRNPKHTSVYLEQHSAFLSALIAQGLPKLSVTGTCLEYGMQEGELHEEMECQPTLSYPIGKNKLRIALEEIQKSTPFQLDWIRLFYMYGKGQNPKSILAQLEREIAEKNKVFNMSAGQQIRDYLTVEKVAEVIVNLALLNEGNGRINCCSGEPITIENLVKNFIAEKKAQIELNLGHYPYPDYEPFQFWGSTKKLELLLNN